MYVRKKKNRSGTTSVVVVSKTSGEYKEVKCFGTACTEAEADSLCNDARQWVHTYAGQQEFDFNDVKGREREETERVISNMDTY